MCVCVCVCRGGGWMYKMIMSMGWDYVSELRPRTGLLFTPQVTYEHGEPWSNNVDRWRLLTRPPELSGNPTNSNLVASRRNGRKEWWIWLYEIFCSYLQVIFTCRKILRHGASVFTSSSKECVLWIFIALKYPSPRPGSNPRTLDLMRSTLTITPPRRVGGGG
jgi:hypothetical protein